MRSKNKSELVAAWMVAHDVDLLEDRFGRVGIMLEILEDVILEKSPDGNEISRDALNDYIERVAAVATCLAAFTREARAEAQALGRGLRDLRPAGC